MAKISTEFGQSPDFFGRIDYEENLKRGVSSQDMLDFVKANPHLMRGKFQEEVRDEMRRGAERERQERYAKEDKERADRFAREDAERAAQKARDDAAKNKRSEASPVNFPSTDDDFLSPENIGKFQDLLNRLQRSKMEQAQQGARESRKGTFAQGIASMMSNF